MYFINSICFNLLCHFSLSSLFNLLRFYCQSVRIEIIFITNCRLLFQPTTLPSLETYLFEIKEQE